MNNRVIKADRGIAIPPPKSNLNPQKIWRKNGRPK